MFKKFLTVREDGTTDWDSDALQRHALLVMQVGAADPVVQASPLSTGLFVLSPFPGTRGCNRKHRGHQLFSEPTAKSRLQAHLLPRAGKHVRCNVSFRNSNLVGSLSPSRTAFGIEIRVLVRASRAIFGFDGELLRKKILDKLCDLEVTQFVDQTHSNVQGGFRRNDSFQEDRVHSKADEKIQFLRLFSKVRPKR